MPGCFSATERWTGVEPRAGPTYLHLESAAGTRHPDGVMLYVGPSGGTLDVFNKAGKLVFKAP